MTSRGDKEIPREDTEIAVNEAIKSVADRLGITMAQVAIAWTLANPVVAAPIVGISNARSLDDAVKALDVVLSDEDKEKIGSAYTVRKIIGHS
jgi:aryl-alcohol dehydrogenase-like predicted oxidoreductase